MEWIMVEVEQKMGMAKDTEGSHYVGVGHPRERVCVCALAEV